MFKVNQVVALTNQHEDEPEYSRIVRINGSKIYLSWFQDENDPRLFYTEDELRPLTKEEIEGA